MDRCQLLSIGGMRCTELFPYGDVSWFRLDCLFLIGPPGVRPLDSLLWFGVPALETESFLTFAFSSVVYDLSSVSVLVSSPLDVTSDTSRMIRSNSAVSSACFWLCRAIFSLNLRGFAISALRGGHSLSRPDRFDCGGTLTICETAMVPEQFSRRLFVISRKNWFDLGFTSGCFPIPAADRVASESAAAAANLSLFPILPFSKGFQILYLLFMFS